VLFILTLYETTNGKIVHMADETPNPVLLILP